MWIGNLHYLTKYFQGVWILLGAGYALLVHTPRDGWLFRLREIRRRGLSYDGCASITNDFVTLNLTVSATFCRITGNHAFFFRYVSTNGLFICGFAIESTRMFDFVAIR